MMFYAFGFAGDIKKATGDEFQDLGRRQAPLGGDGSGLLAGIWNRD